MVVSNATCHAEDPGSIPGGGVPEEKGSAWLAHWNDTEKISMAMHAHAAKIKD